MAERHEYMSPDWIAAAREVVLRTLTADVVAGAALAFSEELHDAPGHLAAEGATIGWTIEAGAAGVQVLDRPDPDAGFAVVADYETLRELQRLAFRGDPERIAESQARREKAAADGRFAAYGRPTGDPRLAAAILGLHDALADITA